MRETARAPQKTSPAAVASTAVTLKAGTCVAGPSQATHVPCDPSVIRTARGPRVSQRLSGLGGELE